MKISTYIVAALLMLTMAACGSSDSFRITGEVEGLGTRSLRFYYYDGERLNVGMATALDGKFRYEGRAKRQTLMTIATNQGVPVGHLIVENGDAVTVKFFADRPLLMEVKGNKESSRYAAFLKDNYELLTSDNHSSADSLIEAYIAENPDNTASAMALLLHYDMKEKPARADSLLNSLGAKARPFQITAGYTSMLPRFTSNDSVATDKIGDVRLFCRADSITVVRPSAASRSLFIFSDNRRMYTDSVGPHLDELRKKHTVKELAIVNVSLVSDTAAWHRMVSDVKAEGLDGWMPGAVSSPSLRQFNIRQIPTFVLVDSTGCILYNGGSLHNATVNL